MNATSSKHSAWVLIIVGALGVLAVEAAIWGGWRLCGGGECPNGQPQLAVTPEPPACSPETPEKGPTDTGDIASVTAPDAATDVGTDTVADSASTDAATGDATASQDASADTRTPSTEDLTPEELLAQKAREAQERQAEQQRENEALDEAERTFWEAHSDKYKASIMEMIDGYFALPMEERYDFVMKYNQDFLTQLMADRKAAKMSAQIRNPQKVNDQFMRMLSEKMSDEEKTKFKAYIDDVVKMQMAKINAELGAAGNPPPDPDAPVDQP